MVKRLKTEDKLGHLILERIEYEQKNYPLLLHGVKGVKGTTVWNDHKYYFMLLGRIARLEKRLEKIYKARRIKREQKFNALREAKELKENSETTTPIHKWLNTK